MVTLSTPSRACEMAVPPRSTLACALDAGREDVGTAAGRRGELEQRIALADDVEHRRFRGGWGELGNAGLGRQAVVVLVEVLVPEQTGDDRVVEGVDDTVASYLIDRVVVQGRAFRIAEAVFGVHLQVRVAAVDVDLDPAGVGGDVEGEQMRPVPGDAGVEAGADVRGNAGGGGDDVQEEGAAGEVPGADVEGVVVVLPVVALGDDVAGLGPGADEGPTPR